VENKGGKAHLFGKLRSPEVKISGESSILPSAEKRRVSGRKQGLEKKNGLGGKKKGFLTRKRGWSPIISRKKGG